MNYRRFGRTGLQVSVVGLGAGGASRLGLATGRRPKDAIKVVHQAFDLGINYFDTAESYGTEEVVGEALARHRNEAVISSKATIYREDGSLIDAAGLRNAVEVALGKLRTDFVDVYHLHRPSPKDFEYCNAELVPELLSLREQGKVRHLAVSESTSGDPTHLMVQRAVADGVFDVVMIGFNPFNQSAREALLPLTIDHDVAVEIMGAARSPFNDLTRFASEIDQMLGCGMLDGEAIERAAPLAFLGEHAEVASLSEACYRLAAYEPGVNVVLVGTGNVDHLAENLASVEAGPLPDAIRDRMISLFGSLAVARS